MSDLIHARNARLETIYAELPQTQQSALGLGYFVREKPPARPSESRPSGRPRRAGEATETAVSTETDPIAETTLQEAIGLAPSSAKAARKSARKSDASAAPEVMELPAPQVSEVSSVSARPSAAAKPRRVADMGATLYRAGSLRSGQTVHYPGNVIILGDVHSGSEVVADGSIVVWGELRGIAHAGAAGDRGCEIRALRISAIQLRIADVIARRPDRMYYHKPRPTEAGTVTPERAAVSDGEIQIFLDVVGK
ncbi:MAG: hypothetical protein IPK79_11605 [Vampirovibrionales bacterium]|nr:hypothetical protein [Vampirovibrionales bacterium]